MARIFRSGKKVRPKTAARGKRYLCARCRKRSPRPVKTPAPYYCPTCAHARSVPPVADAPGSPIPPTAPGHSSH